MHRFRSWLRKVHDRLQVQWTVRDESIGTVERLVEFLDAGVRHWKPNFGFKLDCSAMARSRSNRTEDETRAKIEQYETFVDKRLKPDLVVAIGLRDKVLEQQKVYSDLARNIKLLQEQKLTKLRTMINLGSEVYGQAEVLDATRIFVDIGLGFHAEFTLDEALGFISTKDKMLSKQVEQHTAQVANIKAQIKLVVEGLKELMNLAS